MLSPGPCCWLGNCSFAACDRASSEMWWSLPSSCFLAPQGRSRGAGLRSHRRWLTVAIAARGRRVSVRLAPTRSRLRELRTSDMAVVVDKNGRVYESKKGYMYGLVCSPRMPVDVSRMMSNSRLDQKGGEMKGSFCAGRKLSRSRQADEKRLRYWRVSHSQPSQAVILVFSISPVGYRRKAFAIVGL